MTLCDRRDYWHPSGKQNSANIVMSFWKSIVDIRTSKKRQRDQTSANDHFSSNGDFNDHGCTVSNYDGKEIFIVFLYSLRLICISETFDSEFRHFLQFEYFI